MVTNMNTLISRSVELEQRLNALLQIKPRRVSDRIASSHILCSVSFEHAESVKLLITTGNFTSALGLVRLQYEALVRAMWVYYAATDGMAAKLTAELTDESARKANQLPMLGEMLTKLKGKAPQPAMDLLYEFRDYSWKPLSSFVHGGIHAITRHSTGYPKPMLGQLVKISNGVSMMVGMLLVIISEDGNQQGKMAALQIEFADCLPELKPPTGN